MGGQRKRNAASFPTFRGREGERPRRPGVHFRERGREQRAGGTLPGRVQAKAFKQQGSEAGLLLQLALQRVDLLGQRDIL
jgi:hypothetical protein